MPTNAEIAALVILVANLGVSIYLYYNQSENYEAPTPTTKPPIPRIR